MGQWARCGVLMVSSRLLQMVVAVTLVTVAWAAVRAEQGPPPFPLPGWAQPTDEVVTTFTVTAVPKG